jgi:hypothetical protein
MLDVARIVDSGDVGCNGEACWGEAWATQKKNMDPRLRKGTVLRVLLAWAAFSRFRMLLIYHSLSFLYAIAFRLERATISP